MLNTNWAYRKASITSTVIAGLLFSIAFFSYRNGFAQVTWGFVALTVCLPFINGAIVRIPAVLLIWLFGCSMYFILGMLLSSNVNINALSTVLTMGFMVIYGCVLCSMIAEGRLLSLIWLPIGYSAAVLLALVFGKGWVRFDAGFYNATHTSYLGFASIVILFYLSRRLLYFMLSLPLWILSVFGMLASASRGGIVCIVVFIAVYIFSRSSVKGKLAISTFAIVLIFNSERFLGWIKNILMHNFYDSSLMARRIIRLIDTVVFGDASDQSFDTRADLQQVAYQVFLDNPVFGVGLDNVRYYMSNFGLAETYTHSTFFELLAGSGVVGFLLYNSIFLYLLVRLRPSLTSKGIESSFALALLVSIVVSMFFRMTYYHFADAALLGLLIALCFRQKGRPQETGVSEHTPSGRIVDTA